MTLEFLKPDAATSGAAFAPVARTSLERSARAAGARFEIRDGWNVAVGYSSTEQEREAASRGVGWADVSHLGKLEVQASAEDLQAVAGAVIGSSGLKLGRATRAAGAWWCPLTPTRALVIADPAPTANLRDRLTEAAAGAGELAGVVDVTTVFGAMTIVGPLAREVFARFCALDLRPAVTPVGALRPGSIARQPGVLIRESEERYLFLFGSAAGEYMWTVVADAARHLGGAPIGLDTLTTLGKPVEEVSSRA